MLIASAYPSPDYTQRDSHANYRPAVALMDADIIAYKAAAVSEGDSESEACDMTLKIAENWLVGSKATKVLMCLTEGKCFRYDLFPDYKYRRKGKQDPTHRLACKETIRKYFKTVAVKGLEADDMMGIAATNGKYESPVIVTTDKDLLGIPGWNWNPDRLILTNITEAQADHQFYTQWITGDSSDDYKGIPGVGPKGAAKLLAPKPLPWCEDIAVVDAYRAKGFSYKYCLQMAGMARILRVEDWDFDAQQPKLYDPDLGYELEPITGDTP